MKALNEIANTKKETWITALWLATSRVENILRNLSIWSINNFFFWFNHIQAMGEGVRKISWECMINFPKLAQDHTHDHPAHSPFLHLLHDVGRPCATARTELAKSPHSRGLEYKNLPRAILVPVEMTFSVLSRRETNQLHRSECVFVVSCKSERLTTLIPIDIFGAGQKETFKANHATFINNVWW